MKFQDAKMPQDTIEAKIRYETHGDLIEIEIQEIEGVVIYLTKDDANALGRHLIALAAQI
jgi:hypothetical protein